MTLRAKASLESMKLLAEGKLNNPGKFRAKTLPAVGSVPKIGDIKEV